MMVSFPQTPRHRDVTIIGVSDPVHSFRADSGIEFTRARFSRPTSVFALSYLVNYEDYLSMRNFFMRETRGRALTFDWQFPHGHTITNESAGPPIVITVSNNHGLITGNQVVISGASGSANGTHTVTYVSDSQVSLDGTTAGPGGTTGQLFPFYPKMRFRDTIFPAATRFAPGPLRDDGARTIGGTALWAFSLAIEEVF